MSPSPSSKAGRSDCRRSAGFMRDRDPRRAGEASSRRCRHRDPLHNRRNVPLSKQRMLTTSTSSSESITLSTTRRQHRRDVRRSRRREDGRRGSHGNACLTSRVSPFDVRKLDNYPFEGEGVHSGPGQEGFERARRVRKLSRGGFPGNPEPVASGNLGPKLA